MDRQEVAKDFVFNFFGYEEYDTPTSEEMVMFACYILEQVGY